ncbi:hypothetical protein IMSAGC014_00271 [Bacteroidaceae bacterium]|nr:hypothetical protein IMSAGC014_00271 [Bacteroidaceae bacterium]
MQLLFRFLLLIPLPAFVGRNRVSVEMELLLPVDDVPSGEHSSVRCRCDEISRESCSAEIRRDAVEALHVEVPRVQIGSDDGNRSSREGVPPDNEPGGYPADVLSGPSFPGELCVGRPPFVPERYEGDFLSSLVRHLVFVPAYFRSVIVSFPAPCLSGTAVLADVEQFHLPGEPFCLPDEFWQITAGSVSFHFGDVRACCQECGYEKDNCPPRVFKILFHVKEL